MNLPEKRLSAKRIARNLNSLGSRDAIQIEGLNYTYDDLRKRVFALSHEIKILSKPDDRVGLHLQNNFDCYAALVAILISGRTYVPINEGFGISQCLYVIDTAEIKVLIKSKDTIFINELLEKSGISMIENVNDKDENVEELASEFAYLLFTSGSTGDPKGVPITHNNLDHFIHGMINEEQWSFEASDRFLQPFNLSFDLFVFTTFLPLYLGATIVTVPLEKISLHAAMLLQDEDITVSLLLPSHMMLINKISDGMNFDHLRLSFFCGEALYARDLIKWMNLCPNSKQINIYGPTEATVAFSKYVWNNDSETECVNDIVPIGKPFGQNKMALLPLNDVEKELLLRGPQVFEKYIGTARDPFVKFKGENYYRTGDICGLNEKGNYIFIGRNDGQVKIGGHRIELSDVENKIKKIFPTRHVIVIKKEHEDNLTSIHAFIIGPEIKEIQNKIAGVLPTYMRPSSVQFISELPINLNGKIDRKILMTLI